jgi:dihydropyrimidine dehydrogenase (NAD+) subunit PreA
MRARGYRTIGDFAGLSLPRIKSWGELDLNYKIVAEINQTRCIHCGLCYIACEDGCHQSIHWDRVRTDEYLSTLGARNGAVHSGGRLSLPGAGDGVVNLFSIDQDTCVGCNMCSLVCPVEDCITMKEMDTGKPPMSWNAYQSALASGQVEKIRPPEHA